MEQNNIDIFAQKVRASKNIAIMAHKNPDGDALCSVLAMARLIELNYGVRCLCVYDGNIPENFDDLPLRRWMHYHAKVEEPKHFDLSILLDYGTVRNIGGTMNIINNSDFVVEIDHHLNDAPIANLCLDDDTAAATGVLIYQIIQKLGWAYDDEVMKLLAVAILTDTGNFRFVRNGVALRIMADLVERGVSIRQLQDVMNDKPRRAVQAEAACVANAQFFHHGRLALATIPHEEYKKLDGRGEIALALLRQIKGVEYVVLLKEQRENQIGVSFRGRTCPVDAIAASFGGGGHMYASGAVVADTLENVHARVVEKLKGL
ncbi:MAG: DHH family phosphoesterase [Alphaproteobacteria bacterium]|nr:DHH family phosphoesterase [Alphaproteobacteria bacterium]